MQALASAMPMTTRSPPLSAQLRLSPRDSYLIMLAYEWRYLRSEHVAALLGVALRTAATIVSRLIKAGYLERLALSVLSSRLVSGPIILGRQGRHLVARQTGQTLSRIHRPSPRRLSQILFLDHALRINDVRLAFTLCGQHTTGVSARAWKEEREIHDRVLNPLGAPPWLPVRPDAYLELQAGAKVASFLIEVDLGTTPPRRFAQKVHGYIAYRMNGLYQARYGQATFRVLTVTSTARRLASLKKATERAGGQHMFWFTTFDQVTPQTVLGLVWQVAQAEGAVALLPASVVAVAQPPGENPDTPVHSTP